MDKFMKLFLILGVVMAGIIWLTVVMAVMAKSTPLEHYFYMAYSVSTVIFTILAFSFLVFIIVSCMKEYLMRNYR